MVTTQEGATVEPRSAIASARTALGIELGSTRIKACLIDTDHALLARAVSTWENQLVNGLWTYSLEAVWSGLQDCIAGLLDDAEQRHGIRPTRVGAIGVSAMMHGYLAFGADDELLVPFRTWRNTNTGRAAAELTELFGQNIPLRWSVAHLYQAVLDDEPHVPQLAFVTTLAGYVHWRLAGRRVVGIGDASGMFPIDSRTRNYDQRMLSRLDQRMAARYPGFRTEKLLPEVLVAGEEAGRLTADGAALLDPTGALEHDIPLCPPEGDAGTGMVATNAVAPRTGNVSAGTSIFAMVVLERDLKQVHEEVDLVSTPAGDAVAMVHCNNGASELHAWAGLFGEFAAAAGHQTDPDALFETMMRAALAGEPDGGGILAYNYQSGEPITGMEAGRPLLVRTPDSRFTLANFMRVQVYSAFATLAIGMRVLAAEDVVIDVMLGHGGLFRTEGVAQRLLAAAIGAPIAVEHTASEGGAWGIAVLAAYRAAATEQDLRSYLQQRVFTGNASHVVAPDPRDVAGFAAYLERYAAALAVERAAIDTVR